MRNRTIILMLLLRNIDRAQILNEKDILQFPDLRVRGKLFSPPQYLPIPNYEGSCLEVEHTHQDSKLPLKLYPFQYAYSTSKTSFAGFSHSFPHLQLANIFSKWLNLHAIL